MKREQTDLSGYSASYPESVKTGAIVAFPIDKQLLFIRQTARLLERKHGVAAERFWRMTYRRLFAQLQVQGLQQDAIDKELQSFTWAVQGEMQRAAWAECASNNPRGAA